MKRTFAAILVSSLIATPALAAPLYTGMQFDAHTIGVLLGSPIDKTYSVEVNLSHSNSSIDHAGVTADTTTTAVGVSGLARFPMKLSEGPAYSLLARAGAAFVSKEESYNIPTSVTLTQPYRGTTTSHGLKPMLGGGAELSLSKTVTGRAELDLTGKDLSINLAAIFNF